MYCALTTCPEMLVHQAASPTGREDVRLIKVHLLARVSHLY